MPVDTKLAVVCLGTGKSASTVYDGGCSPGYVLCMDNNPVILFGAGYGVTRQCLRYFDKVPSNIFVFSNRSYMSAELPVIIAVESRGGRRLHIISSEVVMSRLLEHRLAEMRLRIECGAARGENIADFVRLPSFKTEFLAQLSPYCLPDATVLSLAVFDTPATEASCGVCVLHNGDPVLVLTGDCAYNARLHRDILRMAPVVIFDGRQNASQDHASFSDIVHAAKTCGFSLQRVFIGQYGQPCEAPPIAKDSVVYPIVEGAVIRLGKKLTVVDALAADETRVSPLTRIKCANSRACLTSQPKKIYVINNESPDEPKSFLMVQHFRTIAQVKQRISELLRVRPVGDLFCAETGQKLRDVLQLRNGMLIVATKVGGRPFDFVDPPCNSEKRPGGAAAQNKFCDNALVSVELCEYLQQAYHVLEKGAANAPNMAFGEVDDDDDGNIDAALYENAAVDAYVDLSSVSSAEVSSKVMPQNGERQFGPSQRGGSSSSGRACSLRFTTLHV